MGGDREMLWGFNGVVCSFVFSLLGGISLVLVVVLVGWVSLGCGWEFCSFGVEILLFWGLGFLWGGVGCFCCCGCFVFKKEMYL